VWKGEKTGNKLTRDNKMEGAGGMQYKKGNSKKDTCYMLGNNKRCGAQDS